MSEDNILIVDDEEHIRELLKYNLEKQGYKTLLAEDGKEALEIAKEKKPLLILLDLMLPEMDGYDVCKEIRKDHIISTTPIIIITAKGEELDKVFGLELGADDYITKPFSIRELIARVKAVLRRTEVQKIDEPFKIEGLKMDFEKHEVVKNGERVDFTLKEFQLLEMLIKNKGRVLSREYLLEKIWGYEYIGETRTVDVHIRHLRQKVEDDDKNPKYIETIRGVGYRFNTNIN